MIFLQLVEVIPLVSVTATASIENSPWRVLLIKEQFEIPRKTRVGETNLRV